MMAHPAKRTVKVTDATLAELRRLKKEQGLKSYDELLNTAMDAALVEGRRVLRSVGCSGEPLKIYVDNEGVLWAATDPLGLPDGLKRRNSLED